MVDVNNDGTLNSQDLQVVLTGVTSLTAADLGLVGGNTFTANKAAFNTATAADSVENNAVTNSDDTINATVAQLAGSTINGLAGTDTLNVADDLVAGNLNAIPAAIASIETVNLLGGASGASTGLNGVTTTNATGATQITLGTGAQTYNGSDSIDQVTGTGTAVALAINTAGGNDIINDAGDDLKVAAGAGTDTVNAAKFLTVDDTLDGGAGTDTLNVTDSSILATDLNNVTNFEILNVTTTAAAAFTTVNGLVAAGQTLTVNHAVAGGALTFNGALETDGQFVFNTVASANADAISGGGQADTFNYALNTGAVKLTGNGGDDIFNMGANLTTADAISGGAGVDVLNYTDTAAVNDLAGVTGVESIVFGSAVTAETLANGTIAGVLPQHLMQLVWVSIN